MARLSCLLRMLLVVSAVYAYPAHSVIMSGECNGTASDNLFCDVDNGNEWWRLDTVSLLVQEALIDPFDENGVFSGFRVATRAEVATLWTSAGLVGFPGGSNETNEAIVQNSWAETVGWTCGGSLQAGLIGPSVPRTANGCVSSNGLARSSGIYQVPEGPQVAELLANGQSELPFSRLGNASTIESILTEEVGNSWGLYLLRGTADSPTASVPEPPTAVLLILGIALVAMSVPKGRH